MSGHPVGPKAADSFEHIQEGSSTGSQKWAYLYVNARDWTLGWGLNVTRGPNTVQIAT